MRRLLRYFNWLEVFLALLALNAVVVAVLISGVGRSLGWPVAAAPQYAQLSLIWAIMLGADIALREGEHIRVTAIVDMLPPAMRRVFSLFSLALILPFLGFIAWYGWDLAVGNWERELGASGLSYGLVTLALPVGAVLFSLSVLQRFFGAGALGFLNPTCPK